jgi:hypothetical protein
LASTIALGHGVIVGGVKSQMSEYDHGCVVSHVTALVQCRTSVADDEAEMGGVAESTPNAICSTAVAPLLSEKPPADAGNSSRCSLAPLVPDVVARCGDGV